MEKVNSKEELLAVLKKLRELEVGARESYIADVEKFSDVHVKSAIEGVKRDEDKHINIIDEMIEYLG